jgi:O-antigen ligase
MVLVAGIPLAVYWFTKTSKLLTKGIMVVLVLVLMFGMILTASRGGFVALSAVTMIMIFRKPSFKSTLLGILLVSSLLVLAPHSYWERMQTLITGHDQHGGASLYGRVMLLKVGLTTLADHPLLGVGPGNYGAAFAKHASRLTRLQSSDPYPVAHNMYLQFFVENGLIAGSFFLAIFGWAAFCLLRYDRESVVHPGELPLGFAIASALAGMLFAGLFLSQGLNSVLWFMTGVGFAAGKIAEAKMTGAKVDASGSPPVIWPWSRRKYSQGARELSSHYTALVDQSYSRSDL